jgi:hypothetical protein|tara:strand:- start:88 stop:354 length:267 start_codon:yes stop_codon:yes gene_type:complete
LGERIYELLVFSHDPSLYLVRVRVRGSLWRVTGKNGINLVSLSPTAAENALDGLHVSQAVLQHQSSYDEMLRQGMRGEANIRQIAISF